MSNRSIAAHGVLDASGPSRDIASDCADVLADAAHGIACAQADQHGGSNEDEEEFIHITRDVSGRMGGVSSQLQLALWWVPVALDSDRPKALMSSPNPRTVLHPTRPQTRKLAIRTTRVCLMGDWISGNPRRCRPCGFLSTMSPERRGR